MLLGASRMHREHTDHHLIILELKKSRTAHFLGTFPRRPAQFVFTQLSVAEPTKLMLGVSV
jgi:hypothetical protein